MIGQVSIAAPGWVGFAAGVLLVAVGVAVWRWTRRRSRAGWVDHPRAVGRVKVPQGFWHPSMGTPRSEPATELLPRRADAVDATLLIPRQPVRRG